MARRARERESRMAVRSRAGAPDRPRAARDPNEAAGLAGAGSSFVLMDRVAEAAGREGVATVWSGMP
jgi:hypothetical protein